MKNLLLLILVIYSFNAQAQFVTEVNEAYQKALKIEKLIGELNTELDSVNWYGGPDEIYETFEGELKTPTIAFYFARKDKDEQRSDSTHVSYWIEMYMFDKSASKKVKNFFNEYVESEVSVTYFETATTISCFMVGSELPLRAEETAEIKELTEVLRSFLKRHSKEL